MLEPRMARTWVDEFGQRELSYIPEPLEKRMVENRTFIL
jgi:hypothetical protein